ncbi:MAG: phosphatidylglycerophosphatase A [Melioribacter sp.]|uniref:phosphatidylglycerophosphatase A family protein n=1 Tax=Rosettibacter primus TaxID=3111523 RepID=UPI00247DC522|nr:phosphatidylglycerophosphatase A [Melioribacter sp.]
MEQKINSIEKILGSGFYTGFSKKATGTKASLLALLIFLIPGFENPTLMIVLISFFIIIGVDVAKKFEKVYGNDPKEFTLDEIIGTWISLLFVPKKIWFLLIAFFIWRFMDIIKPFPIKKLESIKNGWGVVLDDVLAGIYTFLIIQLSIDLLNRIF